MDAAQKYGLSSDSFGNEEIEAAIAVLRSGRYTMGTLVKKFEQEFAEWVGMKHAVMVNSGSSANLIAIAALMQPYHEEDAKLQPGDEVLVPALAWSTTVWPLVQLGLVPVFVDIDPATLGISLESARKNISSKTKGMFLIHVLGQACPMEEYVAFCKEKGITLIEDCCESFGAFDDGKHIGRSGALGTYSHYFSHHLTTIEGGTVATNDDRLADDLRAQRAHGWSRDRSDKEEIARSYPDIDPRFLFVTTGYNVRPMELQAAIGSVQLSRMDQFLANRDTTARAVRGYVEAHTPWITMIGAQTIAPKGVERQDRRNSWMNIPFVLEKSAPLSVSAVKDIFEKRGIETRPVIAGNFSKHPGARKIHARFADDLSNCDEVLERGFMIGCHADTSSAALFMLEEAFAAIADT